MKKVIGGLLLVVLSVAVVWGFFEFGIFRTGKLFVLAVIALASIACLLYSSMFALNTFVRIISGEVVDWLRLDEDSGKAICLSLIALFCAFAGSFMLIDFAASFREYWINETSEPFIVHLWTHDIWVPYLSVYLISLGLAGGLMAVNEWRERTAKKLPMPIGGSFRK